MASAFQAMLALNVKARSLVFLMFALFEGKEQKDKKESKFKRIFMQIHYYSFSFYVFFFQPQTSNWFFSIAYISLSTCRLDCFEGAKAILQTH